MLHAPAGFKDSAEALMRFVYPLTDTHKEVSFGGPPQPRVHEWQQPGRAHPRRVSPQQRPGADQPHPRG